MKTAVSVMGLMMMLNVFGGQGVFSLKKSQQLPAWKHREQIFRSKSNRLRFHYDYHNKRFPRTFLNSV